eukprot:m51a1_g3958 putative beta- -galactosyltransferase 6 (367) ;mRNA; f:355321-356981
MDRTLYVPPSAPQRPKAPARRSAAASSPTRAVCLVVLPGAVLLSLTALVAGTLVVARSGPAQRPVAVVAEGEAAAASPSPPPSPQIHDWTRLRHALPALNASLAALAAPRPATHYRMFLAVISSQRAVDAEWRAAARRTWLRMVVAEGAALGGVNVPSLAYRIFVGEPEDPRKDPQGSAAVLREAAEYGDIEVLRGVPDTYQALTRKSSAVIAWAGNAPFTFDLLAKVDNDVFVHPSRVLQRLRELSVPRWAPPLPHATYNKPPLYFGLFFWRHGKRTNPRHKNYERVWPLPIFPPYAAGPFYVLDARLVGILTRAMPMLRTSYSNEDAAVGIWLSNIKTTMVSDGNVNWPKSERMCGRYNTTKRN